MINYFNIAIEFMQFHVSTIFMLKEYFFKDVTPDVKPPDDCRHETCKT